MYGCKNRKQYLRLKQYNMWSLSVVIAAAKALEIIQALLQAVKAGLIAQGATRIRMPHRQRSQSCRTASADQLNVSEAFAPSSTENNFTVCTSMLPVQAGKTWIQESEIHDIRNECHRFLTECGSSEAGSDDPRTLVTKN